MERNVRQSLLLDFYGKLLTEKQETIMRTYFDEDTSLSEIAENEGVSRQAVHDIITRSEHKLQEYENKLQLLAQFQYMVDGLTEVKRELETMQTGEEKQKLIDRVSGLIEKWEE